MPTVYCKCGAKYKVPESSLGKRARCKKCGETFKVEVREDADQMLSLEDLADLAEGAAEARAASEAQPPIAPSIAPAPRPFSAASPAGDAMSEADHAGTQSGLAAYFKALPRAFTYPTRIRNAGVLLACWIALTVALIGGGVLLSTGGVRASCLGMVVFVTIEGAFAALCFNTVHQSADGEDDLPAFSLFVSMDEWWSANIVPFFAFMLTCVISIGPALAHFIYCAVNVAPAGMIAPSDLVITLGLLATGLFFWPMLVLALTMGDFRGMSRVGAMFATIGQTFPAYVCTLLLVYGCAAVLIFVGANNQGDETSGIALVVTILGVRAYVQIAAMRGIGIYYRSFQDRFDWL